MSMPLTVEIYGSSANNWYNKIYIMTVMPK